MSREDTSAASRRGPDGMGLNWELQIAAAMGAAFALPSASTVVAIISYIHFSLKPISETTEGAIVS